MSLTRMSRFNTMGLALLFAVYIVSSGRADQLGFTTIDFPGAFNTIASGINPAGDIVGWYSNVRGEHGFLLSKGAFTAIDVPGATFGTEASAINPEGDIVGTYFTPTDNFCPHGFLLSKGAFTTIDFPGTTCGTRVFGINSKGDIVGFYGNTNFTGGHGFLLSKGEFITIDVPDATSGTSAGGITTEGDIVGRYWGRRGRTWFSAGQGRVHHHRLPRR